MAEHLKKHVPDKKLNSKYIYNVNKLKQNNICTRVQCFFFFEGMRKYSLYKINKKQQKHLENLTNFTICQTETNKENVKKTNKHKKFKPQLHEKKNKEKYL